MKKIKIFILLLIAGIFMMSNKEVPYYLSTKDTTWKPKAVMYQNEYGQWAAKWIKGSTAILPGIEAPVVIVGDDYKLLPADQYTFNLDGSSSYSPSSTIVSFHWAVVSGGSPTITNPQASQTTVAGLIAGTTYVFKLTATDANNISASKNLTIEMSALAAYQYYVTDSAAINFSPTAQPIAGYANLYGDPASNVLTATTSNGWGISTVSTTSWGGDPGQGGKSAFSNGMPYTSPADPFNYDQFDSASLVTNFQNYNSEQTDGVYNIKVSGLDPSSRYQFIITGSQLGPNGNAPVYNFRTNYSVGNQQEHNMNTTYTTARDIKFDTVKPNNSGEIEVSVSGQDKGYAGGSNGIISAMKIYEVSKTSPSTTLTYSHRSFYDTMMIWDGYKERLCVVAKPYNYSPSKSYPILLYMAGGESAIKDIYSWDPEVAVTEGAGYAIQHYEGNVYGINANKDTVGFIILMPQMFLDSNATGHELDNSTVLGTLIDNFKSRTNYNYNSKFYIGGFSRGAYNAMKYVYDNPGKVTGALLESVIGGAHVINLPNAAQIATFAKGLTSSDVNILFFNRNYDGSVGYTSKWVDTLRKYAPSHVYTVTYERGHSAFSYDWTMEKGKFYSQQNSYDWFVDPTKMHVPVTQFSFANTQGPVAGFTNIVTSKYNNQTATDAVTGVTLSTNKTFWGNTSGSPSDYSSYSFNPLVSYNLYVTKFFYTEEYGTAQSGGYVADNMTLSGLDASSEYTIFFSGYGARSENDIGVMWYNGGADSVSQIQSNPQPERIKMKHFTTTSDASGTIGLGLYPASGRGSGKAFLSWIAIRKTDQ